MAKQLAVCLQFAVSYPTPDGQKPRLHARHTVTTSALLFGLTTTSFLHASLARRVYLLPFLARSSANDIVARVSAIAGEDAVIQFPGAATVFHCDNSHQAVAGRTQSVRRE